MFLYLYFVVDLLFFFSPFKNDSMSKTHQRNLSSSSSLYDSTHNDSNSNMMRTTTTASLEHLKSQLRKREGEVYVLQVS